MILVGERRAEQRHDPVAHHLVDRALVVMHRLHHAFEHGIEDLARLLGIAVGEQFHRALQVGEQHRDLLALAFERGLRGEDLLGEVLGRVGIRRRKPGPCGVRAKFGAALAAELLFGSIGRTAGSAHSGQTRAALAAELQGGGVFVLTAGALHDAAVRLCKNTGSLYLLGIRLICPRMMPGDAWRFSEPPRARSQGYSSSETQWPLNTGRSSVGYVEIFVARPTGSYWPLTVFTDWPVSTRRQDQKAGWKEAGPPMGQNQAMARSSRTPRPSRRRSSVRRVTPSA